MVNPELFNVASSVFLDCPGSYFIGLLYKNTINDGQKKWIFNLKEHKRTTVWLIL